ncbi:MAG: energy transducer TonB [Steroidobacteraceae bacterium]
MSRAALAFLSLLAAPAASGWVRCDQPGIRAPVPVHREAPAYPEPVRTTGIEGTVEVALTVLRDGTVGWVRAVRAEPRGYFEQAAIRGVRNWRFTPAKEGGVPIECRMLTRVRFTLVDTVDAAPAAAGARPDPAYPPALLAQRIEGYAEVEYVQAPDGSVRDARVITAMPRGEFEAAALAAVRGWRLPPAAGPARRATRRFEFRLPDSALAAVPPTTLASAPFPMAACERRAAGDVALEVETDATGQVLKARVLEAEPAGLFDQTALAVARASRLTPAYRDGQPIAATGLLTLHFDAALATCPGVRSPEREPPPRRPTPKVGRHDESPVSRADRFPALSRAAAQPVT